MRHDQDNGLEQFFNVVAEDLELFSVLHDKEPDAALIRVLRDEQFPFCLGMTLVSERGRQAQQVVAEAVAAMSDALDQALLDELAADYASIYLNHRIKASPEESVWTDDDHLTHQHSMFQVRAWYARFGMVASDWRVRPDDHLALELEFIGRLLSGHVDRDRLQDVARFMDEHLLRWLELFARRVAARCDTPYFAGVAMLTSIYCDELRELIAQVLDEPRPSSEEIEERMKPRYRQPKPVEVKFVPGMGPVV